MSGELDEHLFRREYGRLVSQLSRRFGIEWLEAIEDAVQGALMAAVQSWPRTGAPSEPSAWLTRVARNRLLDELRKRATHDRLGADVERALERTAAKPRAFLAQDVTDDLLRMLFVCCDDALPEGAQLTLALKTLCGFGVREIAERLFLSEANVYKRLARGRERLRARAPLEQDLGPAALGARLPAVRRVLYVLFTEGYLSVHTRFALRQELCVEAMRLTRLLFEHEVGRDPETAALLALMFLHAARMDSRVDGSGALLLLAEQDRTRWDRRLIASGLEYLAQSAEGERLTRFHVEAGIAAAHCLAPSLEQTDWAEVVRGYERLERIAPSPLHRLNRALAVAERSGAAQGLTVLEEAPPPEWLERSYLWSAALADLHRRLGQGDAAARYAQEALARAPSPAIEALMRRRLEVPTADAAD